MTHLTCAGLPPRSMQSLLKWPYVLSRLENRWWSTHLLMIRVRLLDHLTHTDISILRHWSSNASANNSSFENSSVKHLSIIAYLTLQYFLSHSPPSLFYSSLIILGDIFHHWQIDFQTIPFAPLGNFEGLWSSMSMEEKALSIDLSYVLKVCLPLHYSNLGSILHCPSAAGGSRFGPPGSNIETSPCFVQAM